MSLFSRFSSRSSSVAVPPKPAPLMVTVPDETGIPLSSLVRHPAVLRNFAIFVINEGTFNEVLCYYTMLSYRKLPTEAKAIYICNTFIMEKKRDANIHGTGVDLEVNLRRNVRDEVINQVNRPLIPRQRVIGSLPMSADIFNAAQKYVEGNIGDTLARYRPAEQKGLAWFYTQLTITQHAQAADFRNAVREIGQMGFHLPTAISQV